MFDGQVITHNILNKFEPFIRNWSRFQGLLSYFQILGDTNDESKSFKLV